jgi:hypothetical protein
LNTRQDNRYRQTESKNRNRAQDDIYKYFRGQKNPPIATLKESVEIRSN